MAGPPARAQQALRRLIELASKECGLTPTGHKFVLPAVEDPARAVAPSLGGTYPVAARRPTSIFAQGPPSAVDEMTTKELDRGGGRVSGAAMGGGGPGVAGPRRMCAECVSVWGAPGVGVVRSGEVCVGWCAGAGDAGGSDEQAGSDARMCAAAP